MPLCRLEEVHAASSLKKECSIIFELEAGHCESSFPICSCMAWFISQVSSGQFKWVEPFRCFIHFHSYINTYIYDRTCHLWSPTCFVCYIPSNLIELICIVRQPYCWFEIKLQYKQKQTKHMYQALSIYTFFLGGRTPLGRFWIVPPQEFVHGDLGRTKPSMRSFLQGQVRRPRSAWRTKIRLDSWSP